MQRRAVLFLPCFLPRLLSAPGALAANAGPDGPPLEMVTEYPAGAMPGEGVAAFTAALAGAGEGALTLLPRFDAPGGLRSAAMPEAVRENRVAAADAFAGALGGLDPIFLLSSLPFLTASFADARRLYELARPAYTAALAAHGARLLYATPWPPSGLWTRTPVTTPQQLQGLRVRTYDATGTAVLRAAGAAAEVLSFADVMARLRAGTLDAVLSSGDGGAGRRLWEQLPCFTALDYAWPLSLAFLSETVWQGAAPAQRRNIEAAAAATDARQWSAIRDRLDQNLAAMRANGVTISAPDPALRERLVAVGAGAAADWGRRVGDTGTTILQQFRAGQGG